MDVAALFQLTPTIIAIDGPAASGKSTVANQLAQQVHFLFFDTGIMYRAVTWAALERKISVQDERAVGELAETIDIDIEPPQKRSESRSPNLILVDGVDATDQLHTPVVDQSVSAVAANPTVRKALTEQQRRIGLSYGGDAQERPADVRGIIMVGRDIGTVVVPEAPLKVYMDASAEERAQRRCAQRGNEEDYEQVLADIRRRDARDGGRAHAPMRAADDAVVIDTSNLSIDEVIEKIVEAALSNLTPNS